MLGYCGILLITVVSFYISLRMNKFELLAPTTLALLGLLVSIALAIVGLSSWNIIDLSIETICIVSIGELGFLCGGYLYTVANRKLKRKKIAEQRQRWERIKRFSLAETKDTPFFKIVILAILVLIAIIVRIDETYKIGSQLALDASSYSELASEVRQVTESFISADAMRLDVGYSFLERQLEKVVWAIGFVSAYLVARFIVSKNKKKVVGSLALMLLTWLFYILAGGRGTIMYHIITIFTVISILKYAEAGVNAKRITRKLVVIGLCCAVVCALGMYAASYLVGRGASSGIVDYVSFYFGGSIPSLELLLENRVPGTNMIPGINTFYYLFSPLFKTGLLDTFPDYSLLWVNLGSHASNIFTCFARYYIDFGLLGVFVLSALSVQIPLVIYSLARRKAEPLSLVMAGYLAPFIFDCAREEFIFSRLISSSQLFNLVVLLIITIFVSYSISNLTCNIKKKANTLSR